ncbi:MAG: hypothetical protein CMO44_13145 [Verrucomicrobiales bacterium]|nr:hypothetical protein [Verrucomicrobiales bacterium]
MENHISKASIKKLNFKCEILKLPTHHKTSHTFENAERPSIQRHQARAVARHDAAGPLVWPWKADVGKPERRHQGKDSFSVAGH